jgi:hypothetical protein
MDTDEFMRQIFFRGMQALNSMLENAAKEIMESPEMKQQLEALKKKSEAFDLSSTEEPK